MTTPEGWKEVGFTKTEWAELKQAFRKAVIEKQMEFTYKGEVYVTAFAKYFIQHHDPKFR